MIKCVWWVVRVELGFFPGINKIPVVRLQRDALFFELGGGH